MRSAAAAALLAVAIPFAYADTEITDGTSTPLQTNTAGNIVISNGGVGVLTSGAPAITLNSNASVTNQGFITNNSDQGIGVSIDTTAGNLFPPAAGFSNTALIQTLGSGTLKKAIQIIGGHTFYGPISLTALTSVAGTTGAAAATQSSDIAVLGDNSTSFFLQQGTSVTSNIGIGGAITQNNSTNTPSSSIVVDLDGTVNGNVFTSAAITGIGAGITGVQILGGIHSCASDTGAPSGFTCPTSSGGTFFNSGAINMYGSSTYNIRGGNPESGSALVIGGSIDGGIVNIGPATAQNLAAAEITTAGITTNGVVAPTLIIDPARSVTNGATVPRGPILIGPVTPDIDPVDPGYSFLNRGTISAQPTDPDLSATAVIIQGYSDTYRTCFSSSAGSCDVTAHPNTPHDVTTTTSGGATTTSTVNVNDAGGLLNTGTISVVTNTSVTGVAANGPTSATALYIGSFAYIPRLDIIGETITGSSNTPATVSAAVQGDGHGSAFAIIIAEDAHVPEITVGRNGVIAAGVNTNTLSPTPDIASSSNPFSLVSEGIVDHSGSLTTINNAGSIQAANSILTPSPGAVTSSSEVAIDLQSSTTNGVTINNSGQLLGGILYGTTGDSHILNVGNDVNSGAANPNTGVANSPTNYAVVAQRITATAEGLVPLTTPGTINFGTGAGNQLNIGSFGYVNAAIFADPGNLDVVVANNGTLFIANTVTSGAMNVGSFTTRGGTLGLAVSQNTSTTTPVVLATRPATIAAATTIGLQFGSFISSGTTTASVNNPTAQNIILISAPGITDTGIAAQNASLSQRIPFLFQPTTTPLSVTASDSGGQNLVLTLTPRAPGAQSANGVPGLGLSGDALNQFPFAAAALGNDTELGAAIASNLTIYNTAGTPSSGINVAASQQQAQRTFSQFSPDVSGGARDIAIMLTDEATGPVAARQRLLRSYANVAGDMTLWGEEFAGHISNKGQVTGSNTLSAYKDRGFGFVVGVDGGSPRNGWYGGAFTFYSGDIVQSLPRDTRTNTQWFMFTGYSDWRGRHLFLDAQISAAYGDFNETRFMDVGSVSRAASSKRPAAMLALGANTGLILHYRGLEVDPHISLDGLTMREEGYSETGGGPGFDLQVAPYFANSLRTALGADIKGSVSVFGFDLTPEARLGYRQDLLQQAVKIKAGFLSTGGLATVNNTMTFVGPDPDAGNIIMGLGLGGSTDTWQVGLNYDWVRGNNGSTTQVGVLTVLGRI
jgi:hypothetical protein